MLSGEIVASETWDSTAYKLYAQNSDIVFVPPKTGALAWIDTFALPRKGEADDAAYKWINFVLEPENVGRDVLHSLLRGLETDSEMLATMCVIAVEPVGDFITYGIGIPLMTMRHPEKARGRAPVA